MISHAQKQEIQQETTTYSTSGESETNKNNVLTASLRNEVAFVAGKDKDNFCRVNFELTKDKKRNRSNKWISEVDKIYENYMKGKTKKNGNYQENQRNRNNFVMEENNVHEDDVIVENEVDKIVGNEECVLMATEMESKIHEDDVILDDQEPIVMTASTKQERKRQKKRKKRKNNFGKIEASENICEMGENALENFQQTSRNDMNSAEERKHELDMSMETTTNKVKDELKATTDLEKKSLLEKGIKGNILEPIKKKNDSFWDVIVKQDNDNLKVKPSDIKSNEDNKSSEEVSDSKGTKGDEARDNIANNGSTSRYNFGKRTLKVKLKKYSMITEKSDEKPRRASTFEELMREYA
jgi:hypothetical protein